VDNFAYMLLGLFQLFPIILYVMTFASSICFIWSYAIWFFIWL